MLSTPHDLRTHSRLKKQIITCRQMLNSPNHLIVHSSTTPLKR